MSGKPSHIPLFPDAYLRDTTHLTTEEHGAYFLLMMAAWGSDGCSLPNDEKRLAALVGLPLARWRKIAPTILEFWSHDKGRISQKRLTKEWEYVHRTKVKRADAARVRWDAKAMQVQCKSNASAMHLGGGGGEGVSSYPAKGVLEEGEGSTPFRIVEGGK